MRGPARVNATYLMVNINGVSAYTGHHVSCSRLTGCSQQATGLRERHEHETSMRARRLPVSSAGTVSDLRGRRGVGAREIEAEHLTV